MRKNYEILKEFYDLGFGETELPAKVIHKRGFEQNAPKTSSKDKKTGQPVYWYHGYGFSYNEHTDKIKIHKSEWT